MRVRTFIGMVVVILVLSVTLVVLAEGNLPAVQTPDTPMQLTPVLWRPLIFLPWSGHEIIITKFRSDLGDAPDSTNSYGAAMTAYPKGGPAGVIARFPTVFKAGSPPYGPRHNNLPSLRYYLGAGISREAEADIGLDGDPNNNIMPTADRPDLDQFDDGVNPNPQFPNCQPTKLNFTVTVPAGAPVNQTAFVNLWFDWNRNGAWG